ncbi:MAG: ATP-binding protein, partial [Myxococcota bacterium]|nr:ATP-binding protein [Myxococcota bacterium]
PELSRVGVMLVTSKAERDLKIEGLELGADDYVTMPFHPRELLARTRALIRTRVLSQQLEERGDSLARALAELGETQAQLVHREKMASLGQFVAGIAHELNNPLNFVQGNLHFLARHARSMLEAIARYEEMMRELGADTSRIDATRAELRLDDVGEDLDSLLEGCTEGIVRSTTLVADLKSFSRLDRPDASMANLLDGLRSTLSVLRDRLRGIDVQLELEELPLVECIAGQVNQVFMNLISNAADAVGESGVIRIRSGQVDDDHVFVEIEDDGCGIEPENLERLFEPFFTTKDVGHGTGLGLSISYGVISRHGGQLIVRSEPGEGAVFRVELPTRSSEERREALARGDVPAGLEDPVER